MQHGRKRLEQAAADIAGEPIRPTEEHCRVLVVCMLIARVASSEMLWGQAGGGGAVREMVVGPAADERHVARSELDCGSRIV
jgi:hypothetical protein